MPVKLTGLAGLNLVDAAQGVHTAPDVLAALGGGAALDELYVIAQAEDQGLGDKVAAVLACTPALKDLLVMLDEEIDTPFGNGHVFFDPEDGGAPAALDLRGVARPPSHLTALQFYSADVN